MANEIKIENVSKSKGDDGDSITESIGETTNLTQVTDESQPIPHDNQFRYKISIENPYIQSLLDILTYVNNYLSHLFTADELNHIIIFNNLSIHARYIYIRFLVRKFKCIREADYSKYLSHEHLQPSLDELVKCKYFLSHHQVDLSELLLALTSKELEILMKNFKIKSESSSTLSRLDNKKSLINIVIQSITQQTTLSATSPISKLRTKVESLYGSMYKINEDIADIFKLMIKIYLIPGYGEFDLILRSKMNLLKFPKYEYTPKSLFESRQLVDEYLQAIAYDDELETFPQWSEEKRKKFLDESIGRAEVAILLQDGDKVKPSYLRRYTPNWVYINTLLKLSELMRPISTFSHEDECNILTIFTSQTTYRPEKRIVYLTRKIHLEILLHKQNESTSTTSKDWLSLAFNDCFDAISDPTLDDIVGQDLYRKALKVYKIFESKRLAFPKELIIKLKKELIPATTIEISASQDSNKPIKTDPPTTNKIINNTSIDTPISLTTASPRGGRTQWFDPENTDNRLTVETVALNYYATQGWKGYHSESRILHSIFGLLFSDILYEDKNMFLHPYQTAPLDLRSGDDSFYNSHKESIEKRLNEIQNNHPSFSISLIKSVYNESQTPTAITGVNWSYELDDIIELIECLPSSTISAICKLHCENYRTYSSGGPDLCLWHPTLNQCKFVEVKSENDVLSDNQRVWIHNLIQSGVQVELCKVLSDKKSSSKRRKLV